MRCDSERCGKQDKAEKGTCYYHPRNKNELSINDEGNIEISENIIIGKADNIFGPEIYEEQKKN